MTPKLFSELGISPELLKAIDKLGFEQASPIQAEAIPVLMQGRDVVGQSQTGSGKTVAFAVPAVEKVDPQKRVVQVLILCPTRELAVQVSEEVHKLVFFKRGIHALPIYGGQSYERQYLGLRQGAQIVIGTPGRVMDHMRRGTLRLETVKMVILDEADVMLAMGFREDIEFVLQAVPKERQTVFFCATLPRPILDLIQRYARDPQSIRLEQRTLTVPTVEQVYYEVDRRDKIELLTRLIDIHDLRLGIIFCNTKSMVDDLVDHLNAQGYSADRLHGDMSQVMRDRVMNKFRKSGLEFLVATDVAARGIDVDDVQVVFNYDLPYDVEDYVHRIGRTGRAGRSGRAISFVAGREIFQVRNIERYTNVRITRARIPTRNEVEEARTNVFLEKLRATLQAGEFKRQDPLIERLLEEGFSSTDITSAVLHLLQGGEAAPAETRPPGEAARPRQDRPPSAESRPSRDRPSARPRPAPAPPSTQPRPGWVAPRTTTPQRAAVIPKSEIRHPKASATSHDARLPEKAIVSAPRPAEVSLQPAGTVAAIQSAALAESPAFEHSSAAPDVSAPAAAIEPPAQPAATPVISPLREPAGQAAEGGLPAALPPVQVKRPQRHVAGERTRLHINVGKDMGVAPGDIVAAILGATGLPAQVVGAVDLRERHLFVEVESGYANGIIAKLNRSQLKGRRLKVKLA